MQKKTPKKQKHPKLHHHERKLLFSPGVNYFVSALPFLSAAKQGLFGPDVQVLVKSNSCK